MSVSRVTVNVGGRVFETHWSTLQVSSYFRGLQNSAGQDLFVDRDPEAFHHVLELLRDPAYPFPPEYTRELHFYGILVEPPHPLEPVQLHVPQLLSTEPHAMESKLSRKLNYNPQLSMHRTIFTKSMYCTHLQEGNFSRAQLCSYDSASCPTVRTLISGLVFLPLGFTRLKDVRLTLILEDPKQMEIKRKSYHVCLLDCFPDRYTLNNWQLLPIKFEYFQNEKGLTVGKDLFRLRLELELPTIMDAGLQLQVLAAGAEEVERIKSHQREFESIIQKLEEHNIVGDTVSLTPGAVRAIFWRTRKPVSQVTVTTDGSQSVITPTQFRVQMVGSLSVLPPKYGGLCFCGELSTVNINTGYLYTQSLQLQFPPGTEGWVWQFNLCPVKESIAGGVYLQEMSVAEQLAPYTPPVPVWPLTGDRNVIVAPTQNQYDEWDQAHLFEIELPNNQ